VRGYADVDDQLVWDVITTKLVTLQEEVNALLDTLCRPDLRTDEACETPDAFTRCNSSEHDEVAPPGLQQMLPNRRKTRPGRTVSTWNRRCADLDA
jgi:hypothetical protein